MLVPGPGNRSGGCGSLVWRRKPSGKLPITVPRSSGHLPAFYNYKPSARRGYLFDDVTPLYPFGFGLSYTQFQFDNLRLKKKRIKVGESATVLVDLTNVGKRDGAEVVQMYIRDMVSSVTRPIKELKGFCKVRLAPGETRTISLDITPRIAFFLRHLTWNIVSSLVTSKSRLVILPAISTCKRLC